MEIDPAHVAATLKTIRHEMRLTQENVAELSGLTTRTIEKIESGAHRPSEQTLLSLARGLKVSLSVFDKDSIERAERITAEALKRNAIVRMSAIDSAPAFHAAFGSQCAFLFDHQHAKTEEALELVAELQDWLMDYGDVWSDISAGDRWNAAKGFVDFIERLAAIGLRCHMGTFSQVERTPGLKPMIWTVLVITLQALETGLKVVVVPLQANCEVHCDGREELEVQRRAKV